MPKVQYEGPQNSPAEIDTSGNMTLPDDATINGFPVAAFGRSRLYVSYGAPTPILDRITTQPPGAGHHFYRLKAAQDIALEMYRVDNAAVQDLGFAGPIIDVAALAAFANGSDVRVSKIYLPDNTVYVEQATAAAMPLLWSGVKKDFAAYSLATPNGYNPFLGTTSGPIPALYFDGARYLRRTTALGLTGGNQAITIAMVFRALADTTYHLFHIGDNANTENKLLVAYMNGAATDTVIYGGGAGGGYREWSAASPVASVITQVRRFVWSKANAQAIQSFILREDDVALTHAGFQAGSVDLEDEEIVIGAASGGGGLPLVGIMPMLPWIFNDDLPVAQPADFAELEAWTHDALGTLA